MYSHELTIFFYTAKEGKTKKNREIRIGCQLDFLNNSQMLKNVTPCDPFCLFIRFFLSFCDGSKHDSVETIGQSRYFQKKCRNKHDNFISKFQKINTTTFLYLRVYIL